MNRARKLALLTTIGVIAGVSPAAAAVTIGQTGTPASSCVANTDRLQPSVISGTSYVVPSTVAKGTIVSWSTEAQAGAGQRLALKLYRSAGGAAYTVLTHDGP